MMPHDFYKLHYDEYCLLMPSLLPDTNFIQTIQSRQERDPKIVKNYTETQRKDWQKWNKRYNEWLLKKTKKEQELRNKLEKEYNEGRAEARRKIEEIINNEKKNKGV